VKIKIVVHEAEEGGVWAKVPAIPGCATQGDSMEELMQNLHEAIEGCLPSRFAPPEPGGVERMLELPARNPYPAATSLALSSVTAGFCFRQR
jgi:predicted RNase H-like HicB family nuclease